MLRYTDAAGTRHEVTCDAIAGCDGFHGICRESMPPGLLRVAEREYPYAWLGILATVPPSTDELIYSRHDDGFALHTMRTPQVSRLYLQVPADDEIERWSDDRIWAELRRRLDVPGWELKTGPITEKAISPMRSFVATPMQLRAAVPGRRRGAHRPAHRRQGPQPRHRRRDRAGRGADQPAA